jgi:DNA-binding XRE family transcriptional regulator
MSKPFNEFLASLPRAQQERIAARAKVLIDEELTLRALREALGQTQAKVAKDLGVGQDTVSRYEKRADMLLSTLQQYVKAMGGKLSLIAEFPNRPPVRIKTLAEIDRG